MFSEYKSYIKYGIIGLVAIIILAFANPFYSVPTGSRGVVTSFGKISGIEDEGLVVLAPYKKLTVFNIRAEKADVKGAEGSTSDTQPVSVSMTVRYSVLPSKVAEVYEKYSHDGDLSSYVGTATQEVFKAVTARYSAPELISHRSKVSGDIRTELGKKLELYGAKVINIDMTGFSFSPSYMAAINEKVTQEQLKLGAENKLKTIEVEQKQKVTIAEAEATALGKAADGKAYSALTIAKAEAEALKIQAAAIAQNPNVLDLRRIEVEQIKAGRWDGKLPTSLYGSAPIPFMNSK